MVNIDIKLIVAVVTALVGGIVALFLILVKTFKNNKEDVAELHKDHTAEISALHKNHTADIKNLNEKHEARLIKDNDRSLEMAIKMTNALDRTVDTAEGWKEFLQTLNFTAKENNLTIHNLYKGILDELQKSNRK
jgi:uncharacterized membrane protein YgaE (UPF0421/DUF939 family)